MRYSFDGLVVRETDWGENDKRIVLLTAERGRISVVAKGARSMRSKYANATQLFTYGNFEITDRGGYAWLGGASVSESFWGLRQDIERLALASYIVDMTGELTGEESPAGDILRLTLNTLYAIANAFKPPEQIKATFELRALAMSGYMPDLSSCDLCGCERAECMYLDVMNGVLKCDECVRKPLLGGPAPEEDPRTSIILVPMGMAALAVARYIMEAPVEKVLSVLIPDGAMAELARLGETYAIHQLEKRLPSLEFYTDITRGSSADPRFNPIDN